MIESSFRRHPVAFAGWFRIDRRHTNSYQNQFMVAGTSQATKRFQKKEWVGAEPLPLQAERIDERLPNLGRLSIEVAKTRQTLIEQRIFLIVAQRDAIDENLLLLAG